MDTASLLSGADRSFGARLLRLLLIPLAGLHFLGLELYLLPYRLGLRKRFRLPVPVISIGNITSGGTGKTPMAVLVAQRLRAQGQRVVLLSRGHGGSHAQAGGAVIVSRGDGDLLLSADIAGDEPTLLARLLPDVPVVVGKDRRVSGRLAIETFAPDILLLDDALQFWQLHRDLDIVLLDARRPFDNGWLLPRGLLREPPFHLRRAGVVVITRADQVDDAGRAQLLQRLHALAPRASLFCASHAPRGWISAREGTIVPLERLAGSTVVAFSGIANGASFLHSLASLPITVKFSWEFSDHHTYNNTETRTLVDRAPTTPFVTTEKDLTKVAALWPPEGPPLWALRIGMQLEPLETFDEILKNLYGRANQNTTSVPTPVDPLPVDTRERAE